MKHSLFQWVKRIALFGVILAISGAFAACKTDSDPDPSITFNNFVMSSGNTIAISGSGQAVIDWGGGFGKEVIMFRAGITEDIEPPYTDYTKPYTVKLTGKDIAMFQADHFDIKSVSIRNMSLLKELLLHYNDLTALNVSACPALEYLDCSNNNLKGDALNALFKSLPDRTGKSKGTISFFNNSGEGTCDFNFMWAKNWEEE